MCFRPWRATHGSVAALVAIILLLLLGFVALGTEISYALFVQRQLQATASAAALGGATALMTGRPSSPTTEADAEAAAVGFTNGVGGVTVTVNNPPKSGNYTTNSGAVEVIVSEPLTLPLSSLFYSGTWTVSGRAVAIEGNSAGDCALELDSANITGVSVSNGASVTMNQCGLAVNATGSSALSVTGGATLNAKSVTIAGGDSVTNGGTINATNGVKTSQAAVANPYSSDAVPSYSGCTYGSLPSSPLSLGSGSHTLSANGVYCGGLSIGNGGTVTMNPGIYIIDGGSFTVGGGATLTGTGVTIVLTGSGSNYATLNIGNGANVTLSAPTSGSTSGLVFFQDPNAPTSGTDTIQGGSTLVLTGALYFPSQTVSYSNGTSSTATCTQLVAWQIQFTGGAYFNSNCASAGTQGLGSSPSSLVE
jgi:hypothetical protein